MSHVSACFTWWMKSIEAKEHSIRWKMTIASSAIWSSQFFYMHEHRRPTGKGEFPVEIRRENAFEVHMINLLEQGFHAWSRQNCNQVSRKFPWFPLRVLERNGRSDDVCTSVHMSISRRAIRLTSATLNYHHRLLRQRQRILSLSFQLNGASSTSAARINKSANQLLLMGIDVIVFAILDQTFLRHVLQNSVPIVGLLSHSNGCLDSFHDVNDLHAAQSSIQWEMVLHQMVGVPWRRTRAVHLWFSLQLSRLIIGCGVTVTFVFGLCTVLLASVVSGKSRKKNFWGYRKNICARILNGFVREFQGQNCSISFVSLFYVVLIDYICSDYSLVRHCLSYICSTLRTFLHKLRRM